MKGEVEIVWSRIEVSTMSIAFAGIVSALLRLKMVTCFACQRCPSKT